MAGRMQMPKLAGRHTLTRRFLLALLFPVTCALFPLAPAARAIPGCNSPFTTAGEFTCVVPANATSVRMTFSGGVPLERPLPSASRG